MKKKLRTRKKTIAILYHYVPNKITTKYFSKEHTLVDNQTDEIVHYMRKLFLQEGYKVQIIKVSPEDLSELKKIKAHFVFNLVDSKAMEIQIAKILKRLHIPHSGTDLEGIKASNNKIKAKKIFEKYQLPTPEYSIIRLTDRLSHSLVPSTYPVIIKPAYEHCSIGITNASIAQNYKQFKAIVTRLRKQHKQTLIAEEFIAGKELQVTILETPDKTLALPIAEIAFKGKVKNKWNIYGFDEKWSKNLPVYKSCYFKAPPKRLTNDIDTLIKKDAIRAFYALGMRDYGRFDLRYNPAVHSWYFLEGNANAGFDPDPRDAMTASIRAHGMTLDDFVLQIVQNSIN